MPSTGSVFHYFQVLFDLYLNACKHYANKYEHIYIHMKKYSPLRNVNGPKCKFHAIFYSGISIFRRFKKSGFRKIKVSTKSRVIYDVLFLNNQESKQKYHGTLVQFSSFYSEGSHFSILLKTQKLEPPCTRNKQHLQESQA